MAYTKLSISNASLLELGRAQIAAMDEQSEEASIAAAVFDGLLDEEIARYPWSFATARATLTATGTAPAFGWSYQFLLPPDCLRVIEEVNGEAYKIEGRRILADSASLEIRYIQRQEATGDELAVNGGFESSTALEGWTEAGTDGTTARSATDTHSGSYCLSLAGSMTGDKSRYQDIDVEPGLTYTLSFWTKGSGAAAGRYSVYDNDNDAFIVAISSTGVTAATYAQVTITLSIPAGCASIRLSFIVPASAVTVYVDDVSLVGNAEYASLSAPFVKAFSFRLAAKMAVPLVGSGEVRDRMQKEYIDARDHAESIDAGQEPADAQAQGSWLDERGGE